MSPGLGVRTAVSAEYDAVRDLMLEAYTDYADAVRAAGEDVWNEYAAEIVNLESRFEVSDLLVAVGDGALLGAVTYYPPRSVSGYSERWPREWASFRLLAVPHRARGRGVGRFLTEACIDRAGRDGAGMLALGTTVLMAQARAMYERMGFLALPDYDFEVAPGIIVFCYGMPLTA